LALLCAGQSSTLTGTLAGQITMEGFVKLRLRPWVRRLLTRLLALIPAVVTILLLGERSKMNLLVLGPGVLSLQLPFAVVPLLQYTGDRRRMGEFANPLWVRILGWVCVTIIVALNAYLVTDQIGEWIEDVGPYAVWLWLTVVPIAAGCGLL